MAANRVVRLLVGVNEKRRELYALHSKVYGFERSTTHCSLQMEKIMDIFERTLYLCNVECLWGTLHTKGEDSALG